jgi:hypothetical protein
MRGDTFAGVSLSPTAQAKLDKLAQPIQRGFNQILLMAILILIVIYAPIPLGLLVLTGAWLSQRRGENSHAFVTPVA